LLTSTHLELDERLDDVSEGWLAGVEVRSQGEGVMDQRSSVNLMGDSGGGLHHGLHHGGLDNWAGNTKWEGWSSKGSWGNGSRSCEGGQWRSSQRSWSSKGGGSQWSWGSEGGRSQWSWSSEGGRSQWSQWSWGSHQRSSNWDGLTDGINKPVLIEVLGESLQREWSQTALSSDKISEGGGERSGHRAVIDIGGSRSQELGVSLGLSLVETMNRLVAGSRERPCVAGAVVGSVEVGVTVRGIIVQRISFRFCQAERGDNENSDLKKNIKNLLLEDEVEVEDDELTMHFMFV
jgi:hypothetical protein